MQENIISLLSSIIKYQWEYLYRNIDPEYSISKDGIFLVLPEIINSFTMADGMAEEFRDMGLEIEVFQSEKGYRLKIPAKCLEKNGVERLKAEAMSLKRNFDDRYRTNIEITPLSLMPALANTEKEAKKIARYKDLAGFCAVIDLNELNLQVINANRFPDREGTLPNPDSEEPLSTYLLSEWQEKEPNGQLYFTEQFQINRGTSPVSAEYTKHNRSNLYGLRVADGKKVPGYDRQKQIFNRILDSLVFTRKADGSLDAYILPQKDIIQREDGFYISGGEKIEHAISGIMSLCDNNTIPLHGAARENEERPRLGIGIRNNEEGKKQLVIIIVQGGYLGCEAPNIPHSELIKMMKENGCENVLTLDGGGTATMIFQGRTENARFHPNPVITHPGDEQGYRPAPGCTIIR